MILDGSKPSQPADATPAALASSAGAASLARIADAPPALLPAGTALGPLDPEQLDQKALSAIAHFHQEGERG